MSIENIFEQIYTSIEGLKLNRPKLIAIDGVDSAGKTSFSKLLANALMNKGCNVINASIDGFHNPREKRYKLGSKSPEGYYRCSFDYVSLIDNLIKPLREDGERKFKTSVYDFKTEAYIKQEFKKAENNSILLMEGVFLLRPELISYWDYKIFLHVDFEEVIKRTRLRDQYLFGSQEEVEARYRSKYIPGQQLYLFESDPYHNSSILINNNNYEKPVIIDSKEEIDKIRKEAINFSK